MNSLVLVVVAQDVADVLAQEALDALAEFLHAVDVACCIRHVPSGASGLRGLNGLILFLTSKFHETSVTRSLMSGNARIGSTVTGSSVGSVFSRVMHISRGLPLISAEHEPHLPALQFQRTARSRRLLGLDPVHGVEHDHALAMTSVAGSPANCAVACPRSPRQMPERLPCAIATCSPR